MKNNPKPFRNTLLFLMKITLLHVMITAATIVFSYALDTHGQGVLDRKVSLRLENKTVKDVLAEIEEKAGVSFTYRSRLIKNLRNVTLEVSELQLKELLPQVFDESVEYEVVGKQIILKETPKAEKGSLIAAATFQGVQVSGVVRDDTGAPVPGVNVIEKGTTNGTATDVDGRYSLQVAGEDAVLVFSFIGYMTQEVTVAGRSSIEVSMEPDTQTLEEVVVVGYGEQKKATVTGSVTSVKNEEIVQSPVTNLSNALVGRLPGVVFVNRSGEPGYDGSQIRIRGTNTIGNPGALIVIDGIANRSGGLERLNPQDIESITVLKDASAAIYGAQAANGVILVTTKRGKAGKPEINFGYNIGFNTPTRLPEVADAATYATMLNEIDQYRNRTPRFTDEDIQKFRDGSSPWTHPNTDWYGEVIKPVSLQDNLNLSLSGGTDDGVRYFVSAGSLFEDGFYKNSATKYKQYNFRSNIDAKVTDFFQIGVDLAGRQENRNFPTVPAGQIFRMLIRGKPNLPAYWPNGLPGPDIENGVNPAVVSTNATGFVEDNNYVFQSNLRGKIDVPWVKGLNITMNAAFDEAFRPVKRFRTPWFLYTWDYQTYDNNGDPVLVKASRGASAPELTESFERTSGLTTNAYVNYTKDVGSHGLGFMVGAEKQVIKGNNFSAFRNQFISTSVQQLFAGGDNLNKTNNGSAYATARLNYFGRINYSYNEKYLLEMVWRYDGSYIFPENSRWGFFPGFSAGWVISDENFMSNTTWVNRLKIRGSWGQLGNDRIDAFQYLSAFAFGSGYIFNYNTLTTTISPTSVPNPNVTWEVANNSNIGLEGLLFGGKISFEFDYFRNMRSHMLTRRSGSIPFTAGYTPPSENIGELENKGFDFVINYSGQAGGDFNFQIGLNGGYAKNKILFWDEAPGFDPWQTSTGRPVGSELFYNAIGVFKDQAAVDAYPHWPGARPGDIIFEDVNNDGEIDGQDRVRQTMNNIPRFQGGLNLNAQYKNFDLSILFQGAAGAKQYIQTQSGDFGNYLSDFVNGRWTPENPNSEKPRTFNREDEYWISQRNTYWYRSTDYIRLKNVSLGYTLSSDVMGKIGMKSARVYVNTLNLLTFDSFKVYDPETDNQGGTSYPQKRVFNAGVNLTF